MPNKYRLCPCGSGSQKRRCIECVGSSICPIHLKRKDYCNGCKGPIAKKKCIHQKRREYCAICQGGSLCACKKRKSHCKLCHPLMYAKEFARKMVSRAFGKINISKTMHTEEILGCNFETFHNFIQKKIAYWNKHYACKIHFTSDSMMASLIHIDHIKPLDQAKTLEELKELCHYTNTQPLPWYLNMRKGKLWSKEDDAIWRQDILNNDFPDYRPYWPKACTDVFLPSSEFDNLWFLSEIATKEDKINL